MKKKALCLLLAMIMVLSILAGCTSKPAETPDTPATSEPAADNTANTPEEQPAEQPEEPAEQPEEPALEQKTIQLMITGSGKQANSDKVWAAFNEQLQQYVPNTTVEFIDVSFDEYSEKFSQILASGEGVDLAWTGWLINKPQNIADGNLMPLDDLLAEYGQGIVDTLGENVVEIHRNAADGNIYYLPSWQGLCGERRGWLVVTEIAELAGDTWIEDTEAALNKWRNNYSGIEDFQAVLDQATKYLAAAKEAGKLGAGINTGRAFGWSMYNGMYSFLGVGGAEIGITYCDGTFTVKDGVAGEHYKLYAKTMADWYKEGYIRSDIMSVDTSTLTTPKNGEITDTTYVFSCDPYLTEADQEAAIADAGMDMTYLPIEENAYLILGGDTSYAIPYCADEPERAMMVLNAIYSQPDLYNTLIYGIEGEDYTKNADGTITTSYVGASPTADDSYGIQRWIIGSCKNALINNGTDPNYYADLEALEETARVNPFLNFTFDRTNVEGICASILNVYYEYGPQIDNGVAGDNWEELYNNYMAARKDAGIEELVTEFQNQLNAYIEANNITSW
ncbi:MAG: ABC transporter substrate-binding protein [Oscillospiraceae bacterium]|nr:ABC transporter substrate-binding protein [Oscillospiraceae bacterium]